jgi:hypothetical protein
MAGYSGTPLAKKLGIKDNFRAALLHVPDNVKTELRDALKKCQIQTFNHQTTKTLELDFIFLFAKSRAGLEFELVPAAKTLAPTGMLWISWPKKSSGVATDLTENVIRQSGLDAGLVDIKVCAVTDVWSGLKFVIPVKSRPKEKRRIASARCGKSESPISDKSRFPILRGAAIHPKLWGSNQGVRKWLPT